MPKLINIEGIDATGKHTVALELKNLLEKCGSVYMTDFPAYNTPSGDLVKQFLNGKLVGDPKKADANIASSFYTLDRNIYYYNHINEMSKCDFIISDRSYLSNFFYQGSKLVDNKLMDSDDSGLTRKVAMNLAGYLDIQDLTEFAYGSLSTILAPYDIFNFYLYHNSVDTNMKLMKNRGREKDLNEDKEYMNHVNEFAIQFADILSNNCTRGYYTEMIAKHPAYFFIKLCCDSDDEIKAPINIAKEINKEIMTGNYDDTRKYIYNINYEKLNSLYHLNYFQAIN